MTDPDTRQAKKMRVAAAPTEGLPVQQFTYSPSNVFARLAEGSSPGQLLFNRPHSFAFLSQRPVSRGHAVLVLKQPAATLLEDVSPEALAEGMRDLQVLVKAVQVATQCPGVLVQQPNGPLAGQTVPQLHFHILPCYQPAAAGASASEGSDTLSAEDAGPLMVAIQNALPESYAPGFHFWASNTEEMEQLGAVLQQTLGTPGTTVLLNGQLGAGKSTISRGFVRAFCKDQHLDVPSPTFLLCLSYREDLGYDPQARAEGAPALPEVHHMDPYRLGEKADKMAGLIDFQSAFTKDICLIEWPDRMPKQVMALCQQGISVHISGTGIQAAGRHIRITALDTNKADDPASQTLSSWRASGLPVHQVPWRETSAAHSRPLLSPSAMALSQSPDQWLVLGIESSCDDTAAAVVKGDGTVLSHRIASQAELHQQYGGVKPDVARDAHAAAIHSTVAGCLEDAGISASQLTAVAVTIGPGLSLCLQVGLRHALSIAAQHQLPVVPVHHMEAHAMMTRLPSLNPIPMQFPALLLLVSGGHNMTVLCEGVGRYRIIGTTLDDSIGECFDKIARLVGITAIPGGPKLEELAIKGDPLKYKLTMPMQTGAHASSCNYSFSGLKTGVFKLVETEKARLQQQYGIDASNAAAGDDADAGEQQEAFNKALEQVTADIAASFQHVAVQFLKQRTRRALQWLQEDNLQQGTKPVTCLVVAGGVAANKSVRAGLEFIAQEFGLPCICPPVKHCTDNGLMVAWTGIERLKLGLYEQPPGDDKAVDANVQVLPRWPIGPVDPRSQPKKGVTIKQFH